jgi:hypothetical protein
MKEIIHITRKDIGLTQEAEQHYEVISKLPHQQKLFFSFCLDGVHGNKLRSFSQ